MIGSNIAPLRWKPPMIAAILLLTGELLRIADRVDDAGVSAAAQNDEAAVAQAEHERLVVEDQRIRLPAAVAVGLVALEAGLELGRPIDLAGDQRRSVEEEGWLPLLDDREAQVLERGATARGELGRVEPGKLIRRRLQNSG